MNSILGIVVGFACVVISIVMTGNLKDYFDPGSILIVLGGVVSATLASFSMPRLKSLLKALKVALGKNKIDLIKDIDKIADIANVARRNGLLALEELVESMDEPLLERGLLLALDGSDPELIRNILDTELANIKARHADNRTILDSAAAYAPAFGMIGTLIGLINMLKSLSDMSSLGPNMSTALVTTFYGVILANLVFNPLSKRLKTVGNLEYLHNELIIEGIIAIQNGENSNIIKERLKAFLSKAQQVEKTQKVQSKETTPDAAL